MKYLLWIAVLAAALAHAEEPCIGPSQDYCDNRPEVAVDHVKQIACEWPDGLVVQADIIAAGIPLAGQRGVSWEQQCEALRDAIQ